MGPGIVSIAQVYSETARQADLKMAELANTGRAGFVTTYSSNKLVTDSAAGATAMASGTKTNNGMVGVAPDGSRLENIFEKAVAGGKSVGVVTTTSVTDATPAAFLAHSQARGDEFGIAAQIAGADAAVVMGGGRDFFLPPDGGERPDGRNLADEARAEGFDVVYDMEGLRARTGSRLLGLFAPDDMPYENERTPHETPGLGEMLGQALRILTGDPDGFVLVVEGGRIDHAEHENDLARALGEFMAFDQALGKAMEYQASDSTLTIVVTADHDTGGPALTAAGYAGYPPASEAAGIAEEGFGFVRWLAEDHTGTMVPIFARGPGEDLFSGIKDNTDVCRAMISILGL
jgi:alkaline phosphatase